MYKWHSSDELDPRSLVSVGIMGGGVGGRSRRTIGGGGGGDGARSLITNDDGAGSCGGRLSSMMSG